MTKLMIRARVVIIVTLLVLLALPLQAFAEKKLNPVTSLTFYQVEPLLKARSQTILDNVQAYSDLVSQSSAGEGSMSDQLEQVIKNFSEMTIGASPNDYLEEAILALFSYQYMSVAQRTYLASSQYVDAGLQTEMGNNLIIWGFEQSFIQYNQLAQNLEVLQASRPLLEKNLEIVKLRLKLGMAVNREVLEAESALKDLDTAIRQCEQGMKAIKEEFNVNLAQDHDIDLQIGEVPFVRDEEIQLISVDDDYAEAVKKSYNVILKDDDKDQENDEIRKFRRSFYQLYDNILDKQKTLHLEQDKMEVAEYNMQAAKIKFELGMLSLIAYTQAQNDYLKQQAALFKAEDDLFKAYREYEWARKGLIATSAQGAMSR